MSKEKLTPEAAFHASLALCSVLKEIRKSKNISQVELAEMLDLNQETISKMESRKFSVGIDQLMKWIHALDVSIELRIKGDGNPDIEKAMEQIGRRPNSLPKN